MEFGLTHVHMVCVSLHMDHYEFIWFHIKNRRDIWFRIICKHSEQTPINMIMNMEHQTPNSQTCLILGCVARGVRWRSESLSGIGSMYISVGSVTGNHKLRERNMKTHIITPHHRWINSSRGCFQLNLPFWPIHNSNGGPQMPPGHQKPDST